MARNSELSKLLKHFLRRNKNKWLTVAVIIIAAIFGIQGIVDDGLESLNSNPVTQTAVINNEAVQAFDGSNYEVFDKEVKIPVEVVEVIDGDTIRVDINDYTRTVRYLIIDTPEMNYEENDPEDYAVEAKEANSDYLNQANQVYIEFDVGPYTDNYDRILAYVYADDILLNEALIADGFGEVRYLNPPNTSKERILQKAEDDAKAQRMNRWEKEEMR